MNLLRLSLRNLRREWILIEPRTLAARCNQRIELEGIRTDRLEEFRPAIGTPRTAVTPSPVRRGGLGWGSLLVFRATLSHPLPTSPCRAGRGASA